MVGLDANENTIILTIWKNGHKSSEIKLGQILKTIGSLERTVSHYHWGINKGFIYSGEFEIETVEGKRVLVNPETGEVKING